MRLAAAITKECLALARDVHALIALFLMPVVFILLMSLALQDTLSPETTRKFSHVIQDQDQSDLSQAFARRFAESSGFTPAARTGDALHELRERRVSFVLTIAPGFGQRLGNYVPASGAVLHVLAEPGLPPAVLALARTQTELILAQLGLERLTGGGEFPKNLVESSYLASTKAPRQPTAVQQSVPAWLVFAMFFIVIPLSTIFVTERDQGTLTRVRAMGVPASLFFAGKIVPFFLVNQAQAVMMLLVGVFLLPLFGAEALALNGSLLAIALLLAATSLAAIGYALVVAVSTGSVAQATIVGGVGNILLGAVGGVMAPKFLMPDTMQRLADISPMSWALDGMLDILLRGAAAADVAGYAAALAGFALACMVLATVVFQRRSARA